MFPPNRSVTSERSQDADAAIRQTDSDAALARLSAVKKGYLQDPFIQHLVPRARQTHAGPPLINIGTYVRSESIDRLVEQWLDLSKHDRRLCQIVSLGAGSDTRFWKISTGSRKDSLASYIEIDFPDVTTKKAMAIRKSKALGEVLGPPESIRVSHGGTTLDAPKYHLRPADLRLPPTEVLSSCLNSDILNPTLPTLLLFECVLVYMTPNASAAVIQWFVDYFECAASTQGTSGASDRPGILGGIVYEMFGLGDAFGQVMMNNLRARNVTLPGATPYHSLSTLPSRFLNHGFTSTAALTLRHIRRDYLPGSELERISSLEMLDEVEELELVLEHYAITSGIKLFGSCDDATKARWTAWGLVPVAHVHS
ncbi:S-adenosyl-L-methionine-dependent methyltransferase [Hygrophoropsis aurantiaca]|uniref:S-adenosyl-L-methionine-dependent methyltransferase n=1 Tax=Hygrophoropsis aurantiaca TaxID=72124 RepID=A0ACB8A7C2_9AGAM|nr:S-adenosyl-L-methionine-dependent methyltransferase [Hygrophoropsis aurantiaca]